MANKLKKMALTSVDLVRAGANQEANICLFKSADDADQPTEEETGIFKKFLNWLRDNPDDTIEKQDPVEHTEMAQYYTACIQKSLESIRDDHNIDEIQKAKMIQESLEQYNAAMNDLIAKMYDEPSEEDESVNEIRKFNPYHDENGRFSSKGGGSRSGGSSSGGKTSLATERYHKKCQSIASAVGSDSISGKLSKDKIKAAVGRGGTMNDFNNKSYLLSPQRDGTITAYTGTKTKSGGMNLEKYITGIKTIQDAQMWGIGTILNSVGKSYNNSAQFDDIEEI